MNIRINTDTKQVILGSNEQLKLSDIFNFLHEIDADNVDQWEIVGEGNGGLLQPYIAPYAPTLPPYPEQYWEITCSYEDIDSSGLSKALEGANISSTLSN